MAPHRKPAKPLTYEKSGVTNEDVTAALRQREDQQRDLVVRTFPGVKFAPTDAELIEEYLIPNVVARGVRPVHFPPFFHSIKLHLHSPVELSRSFTPAPCWDAKLSWYFFTPMERKYKNGSRPNRRTPDGFWKATAADEIITDPATNEEIGRKKPLVYYKDTSTKTNWMMHQYTLSGSNAKLNVALESDTTSNKWLNSNTLCKIKLNPDTEASEKKRVKKNGNGDPSEGTSSHDPTTSDSQIMRLYDDHPPPGFERKQVHVVPVSEANKEQDINTKWEPEQQSTTNHLIIAPPCPQLDPCMNGEVITDALPIQAKIPFPSSLRDDQLFSYSDPMKLNFDNVGSTVRGDEDLNTIQVWMRNFSSDQIDMDFQLVNEDDFLNLENVPMPSVDISPLAAACSSNIMGSQDASTNLDNPNSDTKSPPSNVDVDQRRLTSKF